MSTLTIGLLLGLLLGMRHAFEPDHLAAVSTLVARQQSPRAGALLGVFWGLGHSLTLLLVGGLLAALHSRVPAQLSNAFEIGVAVVLVGMGGRAINQAFRVDRFGTARHAHNGHGAHVHLRAWASAGQPLMIGTMHGLAGSGAMSALAMAKMETLGTRLGYMAIFGLGSTVGMLLLTGLVGWPLLRFARHPQSARWLALAAGSVAVVVGGWWGLSTVRALLQA